MRRQCASWARRRCGVCVEAHSSSVLVSSAQRAITPRVSIGAPLTRLIRNVPSTVTAASASRLSGSPARTVDSTTTLPGTVAWSCGAPGRSASSTVMTWGSGS